MAESQLSSTNKEGPVPSSPSPIDLAWQEMLNHATIKVKILTTSCVRCTMYMYVVFQFCHNWQVGTKTVMNVHVSNSICTVMLYDMTLVL